jgi:hypothetical protein
MFLVALFFDSVFWHCYSLGFRGTAHTIGFGNIILLLNAIKCGNRLPLNTMRTTLLDFLSSEMVLLYFFRELIPYISVLMLPMVNSSAIHNLLCSARRYVRNC